MRLRDPKGRFVKSASPQKCGRVHRLYFLMRWWLIGKYHCDIPRWGLRYSLAYTANKVLWGGIGYCVIYTFWS